MKTALRLFVTMAITTSLGWGAFNLVQAQNSDPLPAEVVNAIAQKTIQKFNNSSCADLAASMAKHASNQPPTLKDQLTARFIQRLRQDPQLTQQFFAQISTPVLTKLFECGLVPPQE
jgi:DNA-binding transcriptional regulator YiaG